MNTKILFSSMAMGAALMMSGCGGGGSSDPQTGTASQTGTAYYIDAAVSGVNYVCGTQEGITDEDGAFTFEVGQSCTFYLGDIELRSVDAGQLVDGEKLYETDVKIGQILQSLDTDGRPENGITIEADLIEALEEHNITALPTTTSELDSMLQVIEDNGGTVVSKADAQAHMIKSLLAGKTYYIPSPSRRHLTKVVFNEDATQVTWEWIIGEEKSGEVVATIDGNMIILGNAEEEYLGQETDYLRILEHRNDGSTNDLRWYEDRTKAEAYMNTLGGGSSSTTDFQALLSGKTLYAFMTEEGIDDVYSVVVNNDVTQWQFTQLTGTENRTGTENISLDGNTLTVNHEDGGSDIGTLVENADYIQFGNEGWSMKLYYTQEDAMAAYNGGGTSTPDLQTLIVGKTYYIAVNDSYTEANGNLVNNDHVETLVFDADGHTVTDTWVENGETISVKFSYTVSGDTLTINGTDTDGESFSITLTNPEVLNDHLRFTDSNGDESGGFFFTYKAAEATL